jgi:hypothetical protein
MENVDFDLIGELIRAVQSDVRGMRERFNGLELRFAGLKRASPPPRVVSARWSTGCTNSKTRLT